MIANGIFSDSCGLYMCKFIEDIARGHKVWLLSSNDSCWAVLLHLDIVLTIFNHSKTEEG